jgi:hypothetical protein
MSLQQPKPEPEKTEMQQIWDRQHAEPKPVVATGAAVMKLNTTEYIKGKAPIIHEHLVPVDQQWLKLMLDQQTKYLKQINFALQFMAVILLLAIVVSACSAILGAGALLP